jgi:hypothetical protein
LGDDQKAATATQTGQGNREEGHWATIRRQPHKQGKADDAVLRPVLEAVRVILGLVAGQHSRVPCHPSIVQTTTKEKQKRQKTKTKSNKQPRRSKIKD